MYNFFHLYFLLLITYILHFYFKLQQKIFDTKFKEFKTAAEAVRQEMVQITSNLWEEKLWTTDFWHGAWLAIVIVIRFYIILLCHHRNVNNYTVFCQCYDFSLPDISCLLAFEKNKPKCVNQKHEAIKVILTLTCEQSLHILTLLSLSLRQQVWTDVNSSTWLCDLLC